MNILTKKGEHYSPSTVQHFYGLINNMLEVAVKWDYISYNPNQKN